MLEVPSHLIVLYFEFAYIRHTQIKEQKTNVKPLLIRCAGVFDVPTYSLILMRSYEIFFSRLIVLRKLL